MNQILAHKKIGKSIILTCLLLFLQTSVVWATEDISGEWEIKLDRDGLETFATLSISRRADGSLIGKWGLSELADVKFKNGNLSFTRVRKTRVLDFRDEYTLTFKDEKLTGTKSTASGNHRIIGTRKKLKSPALGQWDLKFIVAEREITGKLTISEKPDGTLVGKWDAEFGEHVVSNVKFQKSGKLTYTRKSKLGKREWESTFEGTIEGHKLLGTFKSQRGELPATGERVGALLVGKWEQTNKYSGVRNKNMMKIEGDLTGRYEFAGSDELPIKDLNLKGNQVTFAVEMSVGDMTMRMDFKGILYGKTLLKGKLDGKTIMGKQIFEKYTSEITFKKID